MPFTLCNKNSKKYYCFSITENNEIDLSSCYELELVKKQKNYPSMNKSGKSMGPFGFDIGMTYEEVKAACGGSEPEHIADDRYYVKPKKSHPMFEKYIVWISDKVGVYYVKGLSREIYTTEYGTQVKSEFNDLLASLERKYGKFKLQNTIKSDYYWKNDSDWMRSIRDGARTYVAEWIVPKETYSSFDGLLTIALGVSALSSNQANIWIEYMFMNSYDAKQALDDVL